MDSATEKTTTQRGHYPSPAPEVLRLDMERFKGCPVDLKAFQSADDAIRIVSHLSNGLAVLLGRFAEVDIKVGVSEQLPRLREGISTFKDIFQIQRATPGAQSALLKEFSALEMKLDKFSVYLNVLAGMGTDGLTFADWVKVKHDAIDLKFALRDFSDKHPEKV